MNEPTSLALWGDRTLPLATRHAAEGRGGDHRRVPQRLRAADGPGRLRGPAGRPPGPPAVASCPAPAGPACSAGPGTGPATSSRAGTGCVSRWPPPSASGCPACPTPARTPAASAGRPSPELFLRWLELSVSCRSAGPTARPGRPTASPGGSPEPYRTAIGRLIRFRYRLLPYLYTLAHEASRTGHPLVRPLCWPVERTPGRSRRRALVGRRRVLLVTPCWSRRAPEGAGAVGPAAGRPMVPLAGPARAAALAAEVGDDGDAGGGRADGRARRAARAARGAGPGGRPCSRSTTAGFPTTGRTTAAWRRATSRAAGRPLLPRCRRPGVGRCYDDAGDGYGPGRVDRPVGAGDVYGATRRRTVLTWERDGRSGPERRRVGPGCRGPGCRRPGRAGSRPTTVETAVDASPSLVIR